MSQHPHWLSAARLQTEQQLPYAGALSPQQAFELLTGDPEVWLVDVRTQAERDWVGKVDIANAQHIAVQWSLYPGGTPNPDFISQLSAACPDKDRPLLFLCRSGVRSKHGAKLASEHGYTRCYDILQGFEGDKDGQGHRKTVGGWCFAGLPWTGA